MKVVISYKNADLDGVASAVGYSEYLNMIGEEASYYLNGSYQKEVDLLCSMLQINLSNSLDNLDNSSIIVVDTNTYWAVDFVSKDDSASRGVIPPKGDNSKLPPKEEIKIPPRARDGQTFKTVHYERGKWRELLPHHRSDRERQHGPDYQQERQSPYPLLQDNPLPRHIKVVLPSQPLGWRNVVHLQSRAIRLCEGRRPLHTHIQYEGLVNRNPSSRKGAGRGSQDEPYTARSPHQR